MMNRRGEAIWGTLLILALSILIFVMFVSLSVDKRQDQGIEETEILIKELDFIERYVKSEAKIIAEKSSSKEEYISNAKDRDYGVVGSKSFFDKIGDGSFEFAIEESGIIVSIEEIVIEVSDSERRNSFSRKLNLQIGEKA